MLDAIKTVFYNFYHKKEVNQAEINAAEPPTEENYITLIQAAQKADHQIYSKEKLKTRSFGLNADLPGPLKLATLPYEIGCNIVRITQEYLKKASNSLNESQYKLTSQILNFLHSALIPLLYLSATGILAIEGFALFIAINLLSFGVSILEISLNAVNAYKDHQFSKTFSVQILHRFSSLVSALTPHQLCAILPKVIKELESKYELDCAEYQADSIIELKRLYKEMLSAPEHFTDIHAQLEKVFSSFKKEFITHKMKTLNQNFFSLSDSEKELTLNKSRTYYKNYDYPKALHEGFLLIQDTFKEKKILLGKRVQPWLALQMINSYKGILNRLESSDDLERVKGIDEAIVLLERASYNSSVKKTVALTNIILFSFTAFFSLLSCLSLTNPISSYVMIVVTSLIYYFNSFRIKAILNSRTYHIAWKNCCPSWLRTYGSKIHDYFYAQKQTLSLKAEVRELPRSTLHPSSPLPANSQPSPFESLKGFYSKLRACL